ncbi:MAG: 6-bladed beta-propeller [Tannerella sp.]|jgi:hypothetical protein|nr:6-bladed beta-propeller [Tannerella sp.]
MMKIFFINTKFCLLLIPILCCCSQNSLDRQDGIAVIDVEQQIGHYHAVAASEIISGLEYIPLQGGKDFLVGSISQIIVTSTHIFCWGQGGGGGGFLIGPNRTFCYAFGRNGQFLNEIGRVGQGPGEYTMISGMFIDEKSRTLYLLTTSGLLVYSWDGVFLRSIKRPENSHGWGLDGVTHIRDNVFIGHTPNRRGKEPYNFVIFNDSGQVIKAFDNHIFFERVGSWGGNDDNSIPPFKIEERIYLKEYHNDTLFFLNQKDELIPQFVFYLGKYAFPLHLREVYEHNEAWYNTNYKDRLIIPIWNVPDYPMVGTTEHIFFSITQCPDPSFPVPKGIKKTAYVMGQVHDYEYFKLLGIYDIARRSMRMPDTDPVSRMPGLINDLDGGLSFWPRYLTSDNELIDIWQPYEMKEFLTEEYFAAHQIKDPAAHQRLKAVLQDLKEDDNPVIVVAKLK